MCLQAITALMEGTFKVKKAFKQDKSSGAPSLKKQKEAWIGRRFEFLILQEMTEDLWGKVGEEHADTDDCAEDDEDCGD